jgi:chitinase
VSDGKNDVNRQVKVIVKAPASDNKAPVVGTVADVTVDEKASTSLSVTANDPESQALTYTWSVPGHTVTGSGSSVTLTANEVTATETVQGTVSVSDGVNTVSRTFNVTVNNLADTGKTTWDANTVYVGGDLVWYEGKQYKARWWTRGENPSTSSVWQEVAAPNDGRVDSNDWSASKAYTGGSTVTFNGEQFQARWWTQGEEPLQNSVWRKL